MRNFSRLELIKLSFGRWRRKYICDEDPDDRRERLHWEAVREIENHVLETVRMREAMAAWERENQKSRERLTAAA